VIYTVTLNPSLDYVMTMSKLKTGEINRAKTEKIYPGGKGINVSLVLASLGVPNKALGFAAGFTGREILRLAGLGGVDCDFVELAGGFSRVNVKVCAKNETALNGSGPMVTPKELEEFFIKLNVLAPGDILTLSGNVPGGMSSNSYAQIMERFGRRSIRFVIDGEGELLDNALRCEPWLVKPNKFELSELLGEKLEADAEIFAGAQELQKRGAKNVLVSLAEEGALLVDETGKVHRLPAPRGKLVNSVGAGDSMTAGFIAGYLRSGDYSAALMWGVAAGSANAFSEWLPSKAEIEELVRRVKL